MKNTQSIKRFRQQALNAWNRLSKEEKKYLDKNQVLKVVSRQLQEISYMPKKERKAIKERSTFKGSIAYNILKSSVRAQSRMDKILTKRENFKRFREEYPSLYAKYNSYMYRQGYSSANYFYQNVETEYSPPSIVEFFLDLPGKQYKVLYLEYNYSNHEFYAEMY